MRIIRAELLKTPLIIFPLHLFPCDRLGALFHDLINIITTILGEPLGGGIPTNMINNIHTPHKRFGLFDLLLNELEYRSSPIIPANDPALGILNRLPPKILISSKLPTVTVNPETILSGRTETLL